MPSFPLRLPVAFTAAATLTVTLVAGVPASANAAEGTQRVSFRDASVTVPASWPVLRIDGRPGCVRLDRRAVYVGDPSRSTCPPGLVGRTSAVHLTTQSTVGVSRPDRVLRASGSRVAVVVYSGTRPRVAARIADSVRHDGARTYEAAPKRRLGSEVRPSAVSRFNATTFTGQGFDACTARSVEELAAWYAASPYKAVNMYIGGASRSCAQPNLTAEWVRTVVAQGWVLIPTYVGLQAPCRSYPNVIDPAQAAAQGTAAADDAILQLNTLGLGGGNPIYFDMEAFNYSNAACKQAVLDFLDAWTAQLHARGYVSGVYGSAGSTIRSLVDQLGNPAFDQPDQLWIARWCQDPAACDSSTNDAVVPADQWADHQRIRQYLGGHTETWGGYTINIDSNTVDAAVSPSQLAPDGSFVGITGTSEVYRIVGGAPVFTSSWESVGLPPQPVQYLSRTQFDSMPARPTDGVFVTGGATGNVYRIVGGVATFVPSWTPYGGPQATITVDQAALDNAGTGGVWNRLSSGRPSLRTTEPVTPGSVASSADFSWVPGVSSSAVASYDVRWRRARWDGGFDPWRRPASWQGTPHTTSVLGIKPGYTYCVSVRARNRAGQLSSWSGSRCQVRALDDRRLAASPQWRERKSARFYGTTVLATNRKGATLRRSGAVVKRVGVVATRCPSCGIVVVRVDGKKVGRINLAAPSRQRRQVVMLKPFQRERGTVTVTVRSAGKLVQVDGLVLSRS